MSLLPQGNYFIDLHLHIDGALSVDTVLALADMQGVILPTYDRDELFQLLTAPKDCQDLNQYLERFSLPCSLMLTKETISEAVYRLQEELKEMGLIYAELRFAPQLHTGKGLSQEEVVQAAIQGLSRSDFKANLILCCMRGNDNVKANQETVGLAAKYRKQGVVAVDLAGAEALYSTEEFATIFALAKELGLNYTIHAGEADGANSVQKALDFGANRIGHGVHAVSNPNVLKNLREKSVPLELCITSNLQTKAEKSLDTYPLRELMDAGVKITLNTDNLMVSNTTIRQEFELAKEQFGLSNQEVKDFLLNAADYSFVDEQTKEELRNIIKSAFPNIKNIFFDYGRTVVGHPGDDAGLQIVKRRGVADLEDAVYIRDTIFSMGDYLNALDEGSMTRDVYHKQLAEMIPSHFLSYALDAADYHIGELPPLPGMEELLIELKKKGYKLYILSNMDELHVSQMHEVPIVKYFDGMVCSSQLKVGKPSVKFFEQALRILDAKPEESVFIDDLPANVAGAKECGIQGLVFQGDPGSVRQFLRELDAFH